MDWLLTAKITKASTKGTSVTWSHQSQRRVSAEIRWPEDLSNVLWRWFLGQLTLCTERVVHLDTHTSGKEVGCVSSNSSSDHSHSFLRPCSKHCVLVPIHCFSCYAWRCLGAIWFPLCKLWSIIPNVSNHQSYQCRFQILTRISNALSSHPVHYSIALACNERVNGSLNWPF